MKATKTIKQYADSEDLKAKVEADKQDRANKMKAHLEEGMKKFNCTVEPVMTITSQGIAPSLNVVAK